MQVRTVVDEKVFNISEHLIHHLYANISDDPWVLNDISETILHQLRVTHLTCMYTHTQDVALSHTCKPTFRDTRILLFL